MFNAENGRANLFEPSEENVTRFAKAACPRCGAQILCFPDLGPFLVVEEGEPVSLGVAICRCGLEISWLGSGEDQVHPS